MNEADPRDREIEALRDRLARLSEASLGIAEDLDLDTVLRGVLEGARSLTGARMGGATMLDETGRFQAFITSGLTPEEHQGFVDLPGGTEFFEYLSRIPQPLRLEDFSSHIHSVGLPEIESPIGPMRSFLGAPILHRGERVGNLYLTGKEAGRRFTAEDEETLVMFASHAAMAIANARRHTQERRARADLETLIDTSPVGVVVFDARTGVSVSFNRESRRILGDLVSPGGDVEQLLESVTFRRADGREISLDEFPLAQVLSTSETVRAEEIVIQVPDGRSVTTLVNATPIRSEEGEVESVVVTLQDMTPLEELERQRAEFLGMVSHELRTPLTSIRGSASTLLDAASDLRPAEMRQFLRIILEQADHMRELIGDLLDMAHIETGTLPVTPEPEEIGSLVDQARNTFLSAGGRDHLDIDLPADLPLVMADRRRVVQVLCNLLSNAARYSPESSPIRVAAAREGVHVAVSVANEGRGIPADRLPHLFGKFAPTEGEDARRGLGGSGLGLAICKGIVEAHGGRIWAESDGAGLGARFTFTLPGVEEAATVPPPSSRPAEAGDGRRILVVDDDPEALRHVRQALSEAGYDPIVTADPEEVLALMQENSPHLVLLDLMLPGADGLELMRDLRGLANVPVIFLSGYGTDEIIARAFESGADDYIVKPFSSTELVARVRAALRKQAAAPAPAEPFVLGDLTIEYDRRRVTLAGRPVTLTASEYDLLFELSVNAGQVVTHDQLLRRIWGPSHSDLRLLRSLVRRLRIKLDDDARSPTYLFSRSRVGYRMPKGPGA